ncbi:hypothetical protein GO495_08215 [Chitinophaga oryziterrae]|uniref:RHS repeat protein n=1 Tax=Chitinophaga oryziterrae TaxID=1031224 RepID=A0A6N8J6J8_9BACT|nr:hypothetical protein [Chitinophaga oryziterrae]MVT40564.1 hypothetical protein [Chitinophaga oryziterrae]
MGQKLDDDDQLPTVIPPSPEAFSMTKYGNLPIGLFTGTVQFSVPVYNITSGILSHDISLNYATNGVKVDQVASRVGIDWHLHAGGVISRIIRGRPDHTPGVGVLRPPNHDIYSTPFYFFLTTYSQNQDTPSADTQPDEFSFSFDGNAGKFIIENNEIRPYVKDGTKFQVDTSFNIFTITLTNGNKYIFGEDNAQDYTQAYNHLDPHSITRNVKTAWYLTKIISANNDTISFNYQKFANISRQIDYFTGISQSYEPQRVAGITYLTPRGSHPLPADAGVCTTIPPLVVTNLNRSNLLGVLLTDITFKNGAVRFYYSDRLDIINEMKLDSIRVFSRSDTLKRFDFNYTYSQSNSTGFDTKYSDAQPILQTDFPELKKRLFLSSIQEVGRNNEKGGKYSFEYNSMNSLPSRLSYSQDLFGYFNGIVNKYFFPNDTYVDKSFSRFGGNRNSDAEKVKLGTLTKITYPTGGSTIIEYEGNTVWGYPQETRSTITRNYNQLNGVKNQVITSPVFGNPAYIPVTIRAEAEWTGTPPRPGEIRGDEGIVVSVIDSITNLCRVCAVNVPAGTVKTWTLDNLDGKYYLKVVINFNGIDAFSQMSRLNIETTSAQNTSISGVRVKSMTDVDSFTTVVNKRSFLYDNWDMPGKSSGVLWGGFRKQYGFVSLHRFLCSVVGHPGTNDGYTFNLVVHSNSVIDLYNNDNNTIIYPNVIEVNGNDIQGGGIEHKYIVSTKMPAEVVDDESGTWPDSIGFYAPTFISNAPSSNTDYLNGQEIYTGVFKWENSKKVYLTKKYNYYSKDNRLFNIDTFYAVNLAYPASTPRTLDWHYFYYYDMNRYMVNRYWSHLDSTVSYSYAGTDSLKMSEKYEYNNIVSLQPTLIQSINSKGETINNFIQYPNEIVTQVNTELVNRNRIIEDVRKSVSNGTKVLLSISKDFATFPGGIISPATISKKFLNNPDEIAIIYNYDAYGNILNVSKKNDIVTSYIWDYSSSLPIAKITNGISTDAAFTSFESDGKGNWNYIDNVKTGSALTGSKYYLLTGTNVISKSGLNTANKYKVSYWSSGTSPYTITGTQGTPVKGRNVNGWTYFEHLITGVTSASLSGSGNIDELRLSLVGTTMATYTYKPLIGVTSEDDENGTITYYEYDSFLRLKLIRDTYGNILKVFDYKYRQPITQ